MTRHGIEVKACQNKKKDFFLPHWALDFIEVHV